MADINRYTAYLNEIQFPGARWQWMKTFRRSALDFVETRGFPDRKKDEAWKYTSVQSIIDQTFAFAPIVPCLVTQIQPFCLEEAHRLVFINGYFNPELSDLATIDGITLEPLSVSFDNNDPRLQNLLTHQYKNSFAALNSAFMQEGALIDVPDGVEVKKPIQLLFIATSQEETTPATWITYPRIVIRLGKQAKLTLFEQYHGLTPDLSYFTNAVNQISLGSQASLHYYRLQKESKQAFHLANTTISQADASTFIGQSLSLGGLLARHELKTELIGYHANYQMNGLFLGNKKQHNDECLQIHHAQATTFSEVNYRGIFNDHATGVFNGQILVDPIAQKTQAYLSNKNLLLSPHAKINTKPQLEIFADDVSCRHGATVGQLEAAALFYLRSRGLSETQAKQLLLIAFAQTLHQSIEDQTIKTWWQTQLNTYLHQW